MTEQTLADAGFDWDSILTDDTVEEGTGSLPGRKPPAKSRGTAGAKRGRPKTADKLETLRKRLSSEMFGAGAMIGMGLPVTGYYACQESDNFTGAVIELASGKKEWIEALEKVANIAPGITVGRICLGLGASLAVDRGRADPEKRFMKFLGVYAAWYAVKNPGEEINTNAGITYTPPPGGKFVPVS